MVNGIDVMSLNETEIEELQFAKNLLENPGLAAKLADVVGIPIEQAFKLLPDNWNHKLGEITQSALSRATDIALFTMKDHAKVDSSDQLHKLFAAISGGLGGLGGLPALAVELPISTTIMLRSIADIARSEGEPIHSAHARSECIKVFALGGRTDADDASESGYFAVRSALAMAVTEAGEYLVERTVAEESAPALVRLISIVAERFGIQVSEKAAAQMVPIMGAAGGVAINVLFIDHFQDMARGHFIVRRLERKYGQDPIKAEYLNLP